MWIVYSISISRAPNHISVYLSLSEGFDLPEMCYCWVSKGVNILFCENRERPFVLLHQSFLLFCLDRCCWFSYIDWISRSLSSWKYCFWKLSLGDENHLIGLCIFCQTVFLSYWPVFQSAFWWAYHFSFRLRTINYYDLLANSVGLFLSSLDFAHLLWTVSSQACKRFWLLFFDFLGEIRFVEDWLYWCCRLAYAFKVSLYRFWKPYLMCY